MSARTARSAEFLKVTRVTTPALLLRAPQQQTQLVTDPSRTLRGAAAAERIAVRDPLTSIPRGYIELHPVVLSELLAGIGNEGGKRLERRLATPSGAP